MRKLVYLVLLVFLVQWAACSSPTKEELASLAAKGYYQHLIEGDYEHFLEGRVMADSLPDDFTDSTQQYTSVLLMLCYGDSTSEEVIVPMVEHNGRWMMK